MSRVTSKLQITIPKALAEQVGLRAGDDVRFEVIGDVLVLRPSPGATALMPVEDRLALFDAATERQAERNRSFSGKSAEDRGWTREELYDRALPR